MSKPITYKEAKAVRKVVNRLHVTHPWGDITPTKDEIKKAQERAAASSWFQELAEDVRPSVLVAWSMQEAIARWFTERKMDVTTLRAATKVAKDAIKEKGRGRSDIATALFAALGLDAPEARDEDDEDDDSEEHEGSAAPVASTALAAAPAPDDTDDLDFTVHQPGTPVPPLRLAPELLEDIAEPEAIVEPEIVEPEPEPEPEPEVIEPRPKARTKLRVAKESHSTVPPELTEAIERLRAAGMSDSDINKTLEGVRF